MKKRVLISGASVLLFSQACLAQSVVSEKEKTGQEVARRHRHIKQLIGECYQVKALLADHKRMQSLPDANERLAEYKEKLERIKNPPAERISAEQGRERQEQWEKVKQMHGDKWPRIYMWVRSAVSELIVLEALDTEVEPFCRFYYTGTIEARQQMLCIINVDSDAGQDELWQVWKKAVESNKDSARRRLERLKEQYDVPEAVVEHARRDSKKEWYGYGYKYLIELLSEEKKQEREKELERIGDELAKYPGWEKIEQELLRQPVKM